MYLIRIIPAGGSMYVCMSVRRTDKDMAGNKQMQCSTPTPQLVVIVMHVKAHLRPAGLETGAEARCLLTKETSRRRAIA